MFRLACTLIVSSVAADAAAAGRCPGSPAWFGHAKTTIIATAKASCSDVKEEILARANEQNGWVDPHNGGKYAVISSNSNVIETSRTANPKKSVAGQKYVDKQVFTLTPEGDSCVISACSESQSTSKSDFSTNYCDSRNLYCGSADGCTPVLHDFTSSENSVDASSGQSDWSQCVVKPLNAQAPQLQKAKCPGSPAWFGHAKTTIIATAKTSCSDVNEEIVARANAQNGWVDPHNGGKYAVISNNSNVIETSRTANPKKSVAGQKYVDKQVFTLTPEGDSCVISACSESQSTSKSDFSTNYCDSRNLYCGSADGCTPVLHDFTSSENSVDASSGQSDWSQCVVKTFETVVL